MSQAKSTAGTIYWFNPGNTDPKILESNLVAQQVLAERIERDVIESVQTGAGHHWLLVGPRGIGKTHLLSLLYHRLDKNEKIRNQFAIAWLKEEERGVASFLDWIIRILRALDRRGEKPGGLSEKLSQLEKMDLLKTEKEAVRTLVEFIGDRRLLLIAENLGQIFSDGLKINGQKRFRDLIQQHPFWTILASTQSLFKDIQTEQKPFYGFFNIQHLNQLTFDESLELLKKLAEHAGKKTLRQTLDTDLGRARIRAVHELTGGNPRLLVVFFQFIDSESLEGLERSFLEMVENLTAYYQEQMQPLSPLQQKIIEFLSEHRAPAIVKEISRSCFIKETSASKQLGLLIDRRFVRRTPIGRESYYELKEPLLRICFEVKENMGRPIKLFLDFLTRFYSVEEHRRKHKVARPQSVDPKKSISLLRKAVEKAVGPENEKGIKAQFLNGLIGTVTSFLYEHEKIGIERLKIIRDEVLAPFKEREEFFVLFKLFDTGIRYLETKDQRILLELPLEERRKLQEILEMGQETK